MSDEKGGGSSGGIIGAVAGIGVLLATPLAAIAAFCVVIVLIVAIAASYIGGVGAGLLGDASGDDGNYCPPGGGGTPISGTQADYIQATIGIGKTLDVPEEGWVIAMMVMAQESTYQNYANDGANVHNYNNWPAPGKQYWLDLATLSLNYPHDAVGHDADSVGLFQQRPAAGWADGEGYTAATDDPEIAVQRLLDPRWSAWQFFGGPGGSSSPGLLDIDGWENLTPGQAAQQVQGSAFPDEYNKWENEARALVAQYRDAPAIPLPTGDGGGDDGGGGGQTSDIQYPMAEGTYTLTSPFGYRIHPITGESKLHSGIDMAGPMGTPIYAAADGEVIAAGPASGFGNYVVIDHNINGQKYSTVYGHMTLGSIIVSEGDTVQMGDQIAGVGTEGNSTGPHLHFEVWQGGRYDGGTAIDPEPWLGGNLNTGGGGGGCGTNPGNPGPGDGTIVSAAEEWAGTPYSWGGGGLDGPTEGHGSGAGVVGFDCSGLSRYAVYQATGVEIPRTAAAQYDYLSANTVDKDDMSTWQPGDLIYWSYGGSGDRYSGGIYHVAIYAGNGEMIEAPSPGDVVKRTEVRTANLFAVTRPPASA